MLLSKKLNERLESISIKYGFTYNPNGKNIVIRKIMTFLEQNLKHERVAIWGGGAHTKKLLSYFENIPEHVIFIIDSNPEKHGTELFGIPVRAESSLFEENITTIFPSTLEKNNEIEEYITNVYGKRFTIMNPYDHISLININPVTSLNILMNPLFRMNFIELINGLKNEFEATLGNINISLSQEYARELVAMYLYAKDFVSALQYAEKLAQISDTTDNFHQFKEEINQLFFDIKKKVSSSSANRTVMFMLDGLRQDIVANNQLDAITNLRKKSTYYNNAFGASTHTKACMVSMFTQDTSLNHQYDNLDKLNLDQGEFFDTILDQDYHVIHNFRVTELYSEKHPLNVKQLPQPGQEDFSQGFLPIATSLWGMLVQMYEEDHNQEFYFIHTSETHIPFMSINMSGFFEMNNSNVNYYTSGYNLDLENMARQYNDAALYTDRQLAFYLESLSEKTNIVILSDHGSHIYPSKPPGHTLTCDDEIVHVPVLVYQFGKQPNENNNLISLFDLNDILISHFVEENVYISNHEMVQIHRDRLITKNYIDSPMTPFVKDDIPAFICLRTRQLKYIVNELGYEKLYALPDEERNVIDQKQYVEQVKLFRLNIHQYKYFNFKFDASK
ncbi:sulfatase-like hydrolase/transferase [Paenibacillus endoradicis]|uniref:sulfatase-like hydrolase/transferase n=1 Tax=Paenibacillus endoradicis TaxID=2972487 RepID=UPI0021598426|nr:sulfatase-like hydrolase/transferase [Paenibacillus endoradicis]MCR8660537.1 sulfatase-like hydrolase/transferase [Paenibacillus endoradicis]